MKKYITIAALLAAGTAFANAEDVLKTTFSHPETGGTAAGNAYALSQITVSTEWLTDVTGDVTTTIAGRYNNKDASFIPYGEVGQDTSFLAPWTTVNNNPWTFTFVYSNIEALETIDSLTLSLGAYNATSSATWHTSLTGNVSFTATISNEATTIGTLNGTWALDGLTTDKLKKSDVVLSGGESLNVSDYESLTVSVKVDNGAAATGGGFHAISIGGSVIPEPSAFGLIAGLGALALVASRRRRK